MQIEIKNMKVYESSTKYKRLQMQILLLIKLDIDVK